MNRSLREKFEINSYIFNPLLNETYTRKRKTSYCLILKFNPSPCDDVFLHHGRDSMVVGFITLYAISDYHH